MRKIVDVKGLKKSFGTFQALRNVTFTVEKGEVVGFIGPNGAGKSTTIRILLGMIQRDEGVATIFGKDVWNDSLQIHERISYVPGDVSLWGNLTGGEIIDLLMKLHGRGDVKRRDELIERFDLDLRKKAKTYSKGNRQKVGLIAALAVDADLYIFDEPTSGLDPLMEQIFQDEIQKIKERGKAVLLSSHILSEIEKLADKIVMIRQGDIVETGSLSDLRHLTRLSIILSSRGDLSQIRDLEGVQDFEKKDGEVSFTIDRKSMQALFQRAAELPIEDIEIKPPTLEDLFMRHYES